MCRLAIFCHTCAVRYCIQNVRANLYCFKFCEPPCDTSAWAHFVVVIGVGNSSVRAGLFFDLQVPAGPSFEMCEPACLCFQVCAPACISSVIGMGNSHQQAGLCFCLAFAGRSFGRSVQTCLQLFSKVRAGLRFICLCLSCRGHRYGKFKHADRLVFFFYECMPGLSNEIARRPAVVFKCAGRLAFHRLATILSWSSVWGIHMCRAACVIALQVPVGPSVEMCGPACSCFLRCGPTCFIGLCLPCRGHWYGKFKHAGWLVIFFYKCRPGFSFEMCGAAWATSACAYLVGVIGIGNSHVRDGLCFCFTSAGRSFG